MLIISSDLRISYLSLEKLLTTFVQIGFNHLKHLKQMFVDVVACCVNLSYGFVFSS